MDIQLDIFRNEDMNIITAKIDKIEKSTAQVRKGLFARNTSIERRINEMDDRFEEMMKELHRLKIQVYRQSEPILEMVKEG